MSIVYLRIMRSTFFSKGFSLIELLIVVAIIGVLSSIVIAALSSSQAKGRDSKRVSDIKNIEVSLKLYYLDYGRYPTNIYDATTGLAPTYMAVVPYDSRAGTCSSTGNGAGCYKYIAINRSSTGVCNSTTRIAVSYHLAAILEEATNTGLKSDVDAAAVTTGPYYPCTNSGSGAADYAGQSVGCNTTQLSATPNDPAVTTETCYDQKP